MKAENLLILSFLACATSHLNGYTVARIAVSPGTLVDRISILEIKQENMTDPDKKANVHRELEELQESLHKLRLPDDEIVQRCTQQLKEINRRGWNAEIQRRQQAELDKNIPKFIELAQEVYSINDERPKAKTTIDNQYRELMGTTTSALAVVSIGDLVDRISIAANMLEALADDTFIDGHTVLTCTGELPPLTPQEKANHITHVSQQLQELLQEYEKLKPYHDSLKELATSLTTINAALWESEVATRQCAKRQQFDKHFIRHAHNICQFNDERARLKRKINDLTSSLIVEEKQLPTLP